jgi:hypothetical protein
VGKNKSQKNPQHGKGNGPEYDEVAAGIEEATDEVESEKERKKFEREERKFLKEHQQKSKQRERWVAPVLLLLTVIISYLVFLFSRG